MSTNARANRIRKRKARRRLRDLSRARYSAFLRSGLDRAIEKTMMMVIDDVVDPDRPPPTKAQRDAALGWYKEAMPMANGLADAAARIEVISYRMHEGDLYK
jgi:hypothetical protein